MNYISILPDKTAILNMDRGAVSNLMKYRPKECPFKNYNMFDLLQDFIKMYSWTITKTTTPLYDFLQLIKQYDIKAVIYADEIYNLSINYEL